MWSIYDTFVLITGLILLAGAVVPAAGLSASTRLKFGLAGGALTVLALILGSLRSFTYPYQVFGGPLLALAVVGAAIARARQVKRGEGDLQYDESGHSVGRAINGPSQPLQTEAPEPVAEVERAEAQLVHQAQAVPETQAIPADEPVEIFQPIGPQGAAAAVDPALDTRLQAWVAVHDPATSSVQLAVIAAAHPEFGTAITRHPNTYPELSDWVASYAETEQEV